MRNPWEYPEIQLRLKQTMKAVRTRTDKPDELITLLAELDQCTPEMKEYFEMEISVFLNRLQSHYLAWKQVLDASRQRKSPAIRRVK